MALEALASQLREEQSDLFEQARNRVLLLMQDRGLVNLELVEPTDESDRDPFDDGIEDDITDFPND
jgi:hypothetical protein